MCADRPAGGQDETPDTGEEKEETLGQRLLQEPIWIGLIVILSVIFLFGVSYLIRRKWGRKFNCCEVKKPKEDDNILNADGTITLNSFPLRKMTRPPTLSPASVSPSHPSYTLSETPTPNPATNNHSAAARFFASYKDAERSPISTTVTTDFTRACDTSLSHDVGDSTVGAIVGGRLLLNLHAKEQQQHHQEGMPRAQSMMFSSTRTMAKDKIKRSHSTGPLPKGQATDRSLGAATEQQFANGSRSFLHPNHHLTTKSVGGTRGKHLMNINDMDHIYPDVIVHETQNQNSDEEDADANGENCRAYSHQSASRQSERYGASAMQQQQQHRVDASGARIIEVNIEGGSSGSADGSGEMLASPADHSPKSNLHHQSRSVDSILALSSSQGRHRSTMDDLEGLRRDKLQLYSAVLEEWKNRARQRYRLAKLAAQKERDDFYEQRLREKYGGYQRGKGQSSPCDHHHHHRKGGAPYPLRRTKTVDTDGGGSLNDVSVRRARFSGRPGRMFTSMEELEMHHHTLSRSLHRGQVYGADEFSFYTECDCPECILSFSASFNSDVSSLGRGAVTSQDGLAYSSASYKSERSRSERMKLSTRSVSTTSDPLRHHSGRTKRRGGSFLRRDSMRSVSSRKYRQRRARHGSGPTKTTRTLHVNNAPSSSTDSDLNRRVIKPNLARHQPKSTTAMLASPERGLGKSVASRLAVTDPACSESAIAPPDIYIAASTRPQADVFHTIFSQVVESDDLNSADEEDDPYLPQSKPNAKQNILDPTSSIKTWRPKEKADVESRLKGEHLNPVQTSGAVGSPERLKTRNNKVSEAPSPRPNDDIALDVKTTSKLSHRQNNVVTVRTTDSLEGKAFRNSSVGSSTREKPESTPRTCNVILYDSSASFDNTGTPPVINTKFILTKKHSSLDLINPHRLQPGQAALRNASSMQELTNQASACADDTNSSNKENTNPCLPKAAWSPTSPSIATPAASVAPLAALTSQTPVTCVQHALDSSPARAKRLSVEPEVRLPFQPNRHTKTTLIHANRAAIIDSSTPLPKTPASSVDDAYVSGSCVLDTKAYLSVTDTDHSSSSAHSCQTTPNNLLQGSNGESKVKDSAYQTKQSSVEVEASVDRGMRRYTHAPKEEDRKVTQRLHQAAVKLLVMQQRLRRARQHLSKDSAVHTISEDDPSLDDIIVVSPTTRTFKPGVLYPVTTTALREGEGMHDFPPTIYGRIIEEQDPSVEYEV